MKKKNVKKIRKLKCEALYEVNLISMEYEQIIEKTKKEEKSSIFEGLEWISDEDLKDLYIKRKDRKYAALTIELYALVEQLLKDIYSECNDGKEYKKEDNVNTILDLQEKLKDYIEFDKNTNTKLLADLRNYIIHDTFSLKHARKKWGIKKKNKELFHSLLDTVKKYINNMIVK